VAARLARAFVEISKLSPPQQEEMAAWLLAELGDEGQCAASFTKSQSKLDALADEALDSMRSTPASGSRRCSPCARSPR
jgi:hypothetical protein